MLIVRADLPGVGQRDVRIAGARVTEIEHRLHPAHGEDVFDAAGGALLPGLHDHHIHLRSTAAAMASIDLGGLGGFAELAAALLDQAAMPDGTAEPTTEAHTEWVRVVGLHDPDGPSFGRDELDAVSPPGVPVRVQHRGGALWILNSAALEALDPPRGTPGVDLERGHLWRRDDLLRSVSHLDSGYLTEVGRQAAARGVTGFTDATPDGEPADAAGLARDLRTAGVRQRLHLMAPVGAERPLDATLGPVKVLLDDDALPALDELTGAVVAAHRAERTVAVHCVTEVQLALALAAYDAAGGTGGDRVEHGSLIARPAIPVIRRLGLTVVSQPHFIAERGDTYRDGLEPDELESLYRLATLRSAGVALAAGSDAPFGGSDPWTSIAAATTRRTGSGATLGPTESLPLADAVGLFLGSAQDPGTPRRIGIDRPADLVLLGVSWHDLGEVLDQPEVQATFVDGELIYEL